MLSARWTKWLCAFATLLLLFSTCGRSEAAGKGSVSETRPDILLNINRGLSQKKLETVFGIPPRHEFTSLSGHMTNRCVSYYFANYYRMYYFVFTNDALEKIIVGPRFDHELSPVERNWTAVWKSRDPYDRLKVVREAQDLSGPQIEESIENRYRPGKPDPGLTAAFIIAGVLTAPITIAEAPKRRAENREIQMLIQKFDPFRAHLGMLLSEVERMYGEPQSKETVGGASEMRYYGSTKLGTDTSFMNTASLWVAIAFKEGSVVAVFSDDFFDYHQIEKHP